MLKRVLNIYTKVVIRIITLLMLMLVFSVLLQILGRYVPFIPRYFWTEEVANYSLIWTIFLGSIVGVREGKHFFVDFIPNTLADRFATVLKIIYTACLGLVALIFIIFGYRFFLMGYIQHSELTGLNLGTIYISVPFAGLSWVVFLIEDIIEFFKKDRNTS